MAVIVEQSKWHYQFGFISECFSHVICRAALTFVHFIDNVAVADVVASVVVDGVVDEQK